MFEILVITCDGCLEITPLDEVDIIEKHPQGIVFKCPRCGLTDLSYGKPFYAPVGPDPEEEFLKKLYEDPTYIMRLGE